MTAPSVLIDLRMVTGRLHGIARYALELARRLPALEPSWRWSALGPPEGLPAELGALSPMLPVHRAASGFLSFAEQATLTAALVRGRPDLFHATSFSLPLLWPGRLVATLHDANHLALAEEYSKAHALYYRAIVEPRARRASALITVSEFSRGELARTLGLPPERFQVISNGVDVGFGQVTAELRARARGQLGLPAQYFVVVGNDKPFKNLALLGPVARALPVPLVLLAGPSTASRLDFPDTTVELEGVPEELLPALYAEAVALLLPSRYEGFGLPLLEAMAAGTPVICSDRGALPEISGQAALKLPADDPEAWTEAALRLLRDPAARRELIELGRERAARYGWDDCARRTLEVYRRALHH